MFQSKALPTILVAGVLCAGGAGAEGIDPSLTLDRIREVTEEAAVFGFPLVRSTEALSRAGAADSASGAVNTFRHLESLGESRSEVDVFGIDESISIAVLDLRAGPVVLTVPEISDRYYAIQLVDLVTDNFAYVGTRATGNRVGSFLLLGPGWKGTLPFPGEMTQIIPSPSWLALAIGRIQQDGPQDSLKATSFEGRFRLQPMKTYYGSPSPGRHPMTWPPLAEPKTCSVSDFFTVLNFAMKWQTFLPEESPLLVDFSDIGVAPGLGFDAAELSPEQREAMEEGLSAARRRIEAAAESLRVVGSGWVSGPASLGNFGTDYLLRAAIAWEYLYSNSPQEVTNFLTFEDSRGEVLDGSTGPYTLHFEEAPPVRYLWSISVLDPETRDLIGRPFRKSLIEKNQKEALKARREPVTIVVQREDPGEIKDGGWLQAPEGRFLLLLRLFDPSPAEAVRTYRPPPVKIGTGTGAG